MSMVLGRMSRNHHHLIKSLLSCRRTFHFQNNPNFSFINEGEGEGEGEGEEECFLVKRFCRETENSYFSLLSTQNWATLRDYHSPAYFNGLNRISNICDGLVHLFCDNRDLLWKPSENQIKLLPPSPVPRHPADSIITVCKSRGFGYDKISQDYKVVRFVFHGYDYGIMQIELYSYKNDSWKELLEEVPQAKELAHLTSSAYVDGCCYWHSYLGSHSDKIVSFNFETESFTYVPLPPKPGLRELLSGFEWATMLVEWNGCVGMLVYPWFGNEKNSEYELWVLGKDRRSWDMKLQFHLVGVKNPYLFSKDGRFIFCQGSDDDDDRLVVYDFRNDKLKQLDIYYPHCNLQVVPCIYSPLRPRWIITN